jgi:hypothetical protein
VIVGHGLQPPQDGGRAFVARLAPFEPNDFHGVGLYVEPGPAMSQLLKSKEYRALAEECDRRAAVATDPETKIKFQQMARNFRELEIKAALSGQP